MGAVMDLTIDAMRSKEEAKLKSILAALWHLTANSEDSKAEICAVEGALAFLIDMLDYDAPSKSTVVAENASGVLKNVSSHVATHDDYKAILREKHCVPVLLRHLKSQSTVLVNNVCGTLCNLLKHCPKDQQILWNSIVDTQSIPVLQNLTQSKNKIISANATILLRGLFGAKCHNSNLNVGLAVSITGVFQTHNSIPVSHKDVNVNLKGCADKENARVVKKSINKEMTYCANQSYVSINTRVVDNYKILNNRVDVRHIQSVPEKNEQRKIKYCPKQNLRDENYDPQKVKDIIRTVPLNSPSEPDNFIRLRPCSSPVDESSPLSEILDNNSEVTSNCVINEISPPYVKQRYQNYIQNGSSHHTSPIYDMTPDKSNSSFDEDVNDQPIDYSKKYVERNAALPPSMIENVRPERPAKKEYSVHRSKMNLFGDYAETDIDQPTNYSLRYAEDDTDEDEKPNREYFAVNDQEDTVQTYCTEGTPYQTPFAFSTSTSMSDLREDAKDKEAASKLTKQIKEQKEKEAPALEIKIPESCDEPLTSRESKELSVLNMGIMSPEKPVNYCEEGTPGYFSRVSSLSSLSSALAGMNISGAETTADKTAEVLNDSYESEEKIIEEKEDEKVESKDHVDGPPITKVVTTVEKDAPKTVSFGADGQCNETPLMFSRCSSLSSLSGFEQHSIPEDRSSTYDFSRRTSGLISPSEIPDSPTQTVPPSPKHHKSLCGEFLRKTNDDKVSARNFLVTKFSATSGLNTLTIDDDVPRTLDNSKDKTEEPIKIVKIEEEKSTEIADTSAHSEKEREQISDADEDDEDILAACINLGMRSNRYRQSSKKSGHVKSESSLPPVPNFPRYQPCPALKCIDSNISLMKSSSIVSKSKSNIVEAVVPTDTVHVYCTEDTPADISPVGSQSNLSALSLASIPDYDEDLLITNQQKILEETERKSELSDESLNLSGDEEKLLDKCIQSGMPKDRQKVVSSSRGSTSMPVNKKCENKFKRCGTPSTSPVETVPEPSASSTLCPQYSTTVLNMETEMFDDSSNHSEDEAILAQCIKSAMPKERSNAALSVMQQMSPSIPKLTNVAASGSNLCRCPTVSPLRSNYLEPVPRLEKKARLEPSEDSPSLSEEEEDLMLAQCKKSGMPKAQNKQSNKSALKTWKKS